MGFMAKARVGHGLRKIYQFVCKLTIESMAKASVGRKMDILRIQLATGRWIRCRRIP
jgi:hypothetical protein